jgi:hypothetical protein
MVMRIWTTLNQRTALEHQRVTVTVPLTRRIDFEKFCSDSESLTGVDR